MTDLSRIGSTPDPTIRPANARAITGRVSDAPVRQIDQATPAGERPANAPAFKVALGAGASGVAAGADAVSAQLDAQMPAGVLAFERAGSAYRETAGRQVEIMRAEPPLDFSI